MSELILVTGGAGFVGSHLADVLLREGYRVRALDNLSEQVHEKGDWPDYLDPRVERMHGDVRDPEKVRDALKGVSAVFHLAAAVGVGQSMYQIEHYTSVNNLGTAVLLEALSQSNVKKLIVASSMSLYGEGMYENAAGQLCTPEERTVEDMRAGRWELSLGSQPLKPVATPETKPASPSSVYALSKYDQEKLCLMVGPTLGISTTALRFFNIYGPRQSLSNPYTGVLAIFSARLLNERSPVIFEDGHQRRDFVSVHDVAQACLLALESDRSAGKVYNVGSGENYKIAHIAKTIAKTLGVEHIEPEITGQFRVGDIRHCFGNIDKIRRELHFRPAVTFADGIAELARWLSGQKAEDRVDVMRRELSSRGLSA